MYNFELIIREKTEFELSSVSFLIPQINVSGVKLLMSNPKESPHEIPWINTEFVKYWIGSFKRNEGEINPEGVILLKIKNFPRYPKLDNPTTLAKNRISITKVHQTTFNQDKNDSNHRGIREPKKAFDPRDN